MHETRARPRTTLALCATSTLFSLLACLAGCAAPAHRVVLTTEAKVASEFDLWSKAVEVASASTGWVPGKVYTRLEIRDGDKELEATKEIWSKLTKSLDGSKEPQVEIVKAADDGKDTTEEEQKRAKERAAKRKQAQAEGKAAKLEFEHPFEADKQAKVKAERSGEAKKVQDRQCVGFRWEASQSDGIVFSGTAWLDQDTGVPLQIVFGMNPLPDKVNALETKVSYQTTPDGRWLANEMFIEAQGSFLFFTKHIHTHIVFSEHWKQD